MENSELELPREMVEEFAARARVLTDLYKELSNPETARFLIAALIGRDQESYSAFLDRLKPERWPLGRPELCIRIPDYVRRELSTERYVSVWVFRTNLTRRERIMAVTILWQMYRQGKDTTTREADVFGNTNGFPQLGRRTIVPDGPYQDALKAEGLLEEAFERVQDQFEVWFPTGGFVDLCVPR
jgi:hypothetical protein